MKLEGHIGEINLVEHLVEFGRQSFTGAIRFENDGIIKILYFKGGDILSASTNDRADSVDEILMRANKVSRDHVKQALAKRKENETLGDALLNLGFITRKELQWARRVQVIGVIRSVANWSDGSFTVVADYLPKREEGTLFPLQQIIVELLVTEPDRGKVERQVDAGNAVFAKATDFEATFRRLGLNEDADAIAAQIDGTRTAAEIAAQTGKDPFNTYKLLHALATLGLVSRATSGGVQKPVPGFDDDFRAAGVADAADMWATTKRPELELEPEPEPKPAPVRAAPPAPERTPPAPALPYQPPAPPPPPIINRPLPGEDPIPSRIEKIEIGESAAPVRSAIPPRKSARVAKSTPLSSKALQPSGGYRWTALITIIVLAILAFAGYAGYIWWEGRRAAPVVAQPATTSPPPAQQTTPPPPVEEQPLVVSAAPPNVGTGFSPSQSGLKPAPTSPPRAPTTPAPAPTTTVRGGSNAVRERYDTMARQFASNPTGNFTVQIALVCQTSSITTALEGGGNRVWFTPTTYRAQPCYRLFYGRYETREAAERAVAGIPESVRAGAKPVVVSVPRG